MSEVSVTTPMGVIIGACAVGCATAGALVYATIKLGIECGNILIHNENEAEKFLEQYYAQSKEQTTCKPSCHLHAGLTEEELSKLSLEELKLQALHNISPFMVLEGHEEKFNQCLGHVLNADNINSFKESVDDCYKFLKKENTDVFRTSLTNTLHGVSQSLGYSKVLSYDLPSGDVVVVAENPKTNKALVNELHVNQDDEPSLACETLGYRGDECKKAMSEYLSELKRKGILVQTKERKSTQGIKTLSTSKKIRDKQKGNSRKRQVLNQQLLLKNRI